MDKYIFGEEGLTKAVGGMLALLLLLLVIGKGYDLYQDFSHKNPKNTISVSAEGKVSAVPDLATVNLGVLTQGPTAAAVQDENSKKINKIIEFVKQQGISKDDIATSQFNIYPQQNYQAGRSIIIGYQANQTITVKIRGVDKSTEKLGKILDGVTNNGANQINGVSLSFDDPDNLRQQAREQAISKAKEKAGELAKIAGLRLGRVINLSESGNTPGPIPSYVEGFGGGGLERSVAPNIEPGNQDITASMTVVFEVK